MGINPSRKNWCVRSELDGNEIIKYFSEMGPAVKRRVLVFEDWSEDDCSEENIKCLQVLMTEMNVVIILTSRRRSVALKNCQECSESQTSGCMSSIITSQQQSGNKTAVRSCIFETTVCHAGPPSK